MLTADTITPHGNARHGHSRSAETGKATPTYRTWVSMLARCNNPNASNYARYGGRGICVCQRWETFEYFLADMGERPEGTTLDAEDAKLVRLCFVAINERSPIGFSARARCAEILSARKER